MPSRLEGPITLQAQTLAIWLVEIARALSLRL
jgi:hypothetical protein